MSRSINNSFKRAYWCLRGGDLGSALGTALLPPKASDKFVAGLRHKRKFGRFPEHRDPKRFRDRMLSILLSSDGRSELRARVTDKELVKEFVRERLGDGYSAKTVAVLRDPEEVAEFRFPERCAIKATHDSGGIVIRRHGEPVDRARIAKWFGVNYYWDGREPNYDGLIPKVLVEELLTLPGSEDLPDYKIFCFRGVPAFIQVDVDRFVDHKRSFYSPRWNELDFRMNHPHPGRLVPPPPHLEEMLVSAARLSEGFSFVRVDFFQLEDRIVVGELTNFPEGTLTDFEPDVADFKAGTLFDDPHQDVELLFGASLPCAGSVAVA